MADRARRHPGNVAGAWFVDEHCIDCDASRQCAPTIFGSAEGQSVVVRQPSSDEEIAAAMRALLVCPTGSIGVEGPLPRLAAPMPHLLTNGIYLCGYNARSSFGASSYFAVRPGGNLLVDSPRFVPSLAQRFAELGGLSLVLLTHRDDVADAQRYADRFNARVVIHEADRSAAPFATELLRGVEPTRLRDDLLAIPVPGHTRGSVVYLLDDILFSGDSLYFSRGLGTLSAFRAQCWYSWPEQTRSLARLGAQRFAHVFPGHGGPVSATAETLHAQLAALVARMPTLDDTPW